MPASKHFSGNCFIKTAVYKEGLRVGNIETVETAERRNTLRADAESEKWTRKGKLETRNINLLKSIEASGFRSVLIIIDTNLNRYCKQPPGFILMEGWKVSERKTKSRKEQSTDYKTKLVGQQAL